MEIYINSQKLPFELENEKNSFDIIKALSDFAVQAKPKQFITRIQIDDREYSLADEESMKKISVEIINNIQIETGDIYGITHSSFNQIENFILLLEEIFLKKRWDDAILKLADSIKWMKDGIRLIVSLFDPQESQLGHYKVQFFENCDHLYLLLNTIDKTFFTSDDKRIEEALIFIENLKNNLKLFENWLISNFKLPNKDYILGGINKMIDDFEIILPRLENVPLLYQTGEDEEIMNIIKNLADLLEQSINLFILFKETFDLRIDQYMVNQVSFEDFFKAITGHLKELMEAIRNNDSVMIGDLLEYEFIPNIKEINNLLVKIKEEAFLKIN